MLFMKIETIDDDQRILDKVIDIWKLEEKEYKERLENQVIEREKAIEEDKLKLDYLQKERQMVNQVIR